MKQRFTFYILLLILCCTAFVFGGAWQSEHVINNKTKQCAFYWKGDEFSHYALPPDWESLSLPPIIISEEERSAAMPDYEEYCKNLGYTYSTENIGIGGRTFFYYFSIFLNNIHLIILGFFILAIILWLNKRKGRKVNLPPAH
jgi:hypothetical protein